MSNDRRRERRNGKLTTATTTISLSPLFVSLNNLPFPSFILVLCFIELKHLFYMGTPNVTRKRWKIPLFSTLLVIRQDFRWPITNVENGFNHSRCMMSFVGNMGVHFRCRAWGVRRSYIFYLIVNYSRWPTPRRRKWVLVSQRPSHSVGKK